MSKRLSDWKAQGIVELGRGRIRILDDHTLQGIASAPNEKLVLMPLEASSVIGSLAGISELANEVMGKNKGPAA